MFTKFDAIVALVENPSFILEEDNSITWLSVDKTQPSEEQIQAKIAELQAAEPMRQLRQQRNQLLASTDWRFRSDLTPSQAWIDYCQALRDITTQTPSLDSDGNLTGVIWPEIPQ